MGVERHRRGFGSNNLPIVGTFDQWVSDFFSQPQKVWAWVFEQKISASFKSSSYARPPTASPAAKHWRAHHGLFARKKHNYKNKKTVPNRSFFSCLCKTVQGGLRIGRRGGTLSPFRTPQVCAPFIPFVDSPWEACRRWDKREKLEHESIPTRTYLLDDTPSNIASVSRKSGVECLLCLKYRQLCSSSSQDKVGFFSSISSEIRSWLDLSSPARFTSPWD